LYFTNLEFNLINKNHYLVLQNSNKSLILMHYESNNTINYSPDIANLFCWSAKISEWRPETVPGYCRNRSDEVMACKPDQLCSGQIWISPKVIHHHHLEPVPYILRKHSTNDAKDILFALNMDERFCGKLRWAVPDRNPILKAGLLPLLNQIGIYL